MVDQEAFHTQWYNKASDVVYGHEKDNVLMSHLWTMVSQNMFLRLNLIFNLVSDGNNVSFISLI